MDQASRARAADPVAVTGVGAEAAPGTWAALRGDGALAPSGALAHDVQPLEYLRQRKTLKLMSKQDRLAVAAAGKALGAAGLSGAHDSAECGLFLAVGYIPFQRTEAESLARHSEEGGCFSIERFSREAFACVNPLLAFACLPNMPAFHVSANFGLQGQYMVTYPGSAELYLALHEAVERLYANELRFALVGAAADQQNFLVENQLAKDGLPHMRAADAAAFAVLERESVARARGRRVLARLTLLEWASCGTPHARGEAPIDLGAVDLPLRLVAALESGHAFEHEQSDATRVWRSRWEIA